uniref:CDP-alcohol phosphatidyltransferase family protein n=1 Tax=Stappia sp. TaxID=1870903 RepID=UPI003BA890ED
MTTTSKSDPGTGKQGQGAPTLADMLRRFRRDSLARELRTDWAVALLYRVPSLVLVRLLLPTGVSPTAVTLAGLLLVVAMPVAALAFSVWWAALAVGLLGIVFQVIDCVDGGLARATGRSSRLGAVVDYLVDMAQWGALYVSTGIVADRVIAAIEGGEPGLAWTLVGLGAAWTRLLARVVRDAVPAEQDAKAAPLPRLTAGGTIVALFAGLSGAIAPMVLAGALWGFLPGVLVFLLVYALADVADALVATLAAASRQEGGRDGAGDAPK